MRPVEQRILETLRREPSFLAALATIGKDGWPQVRYMRGTIDDNLTIRCPTFAGTSKVTQIRENPRIHLTCGNTDADSAGTYLQVEGTAVISDDPVDRRLAWTRRLEKWFQGPDDPNYVVVKINPSRIEALPIGGGAPAQVWIAEAGETQPT